MSGIDVCGKLMEVALFVWVGLASYRRGRKDERSNRLTVKPGDFNTAGVYPASKLAGYDVDPFGRAVCPRCFAFRSARIGMRFEHGYLVCLACDLTVPAAEDGAALDELANRGLITAEQADEAARISAQKGVAV